MPEGKYDNLDSTKLLECLTNVRVEIDKRIKILGRDFRALMNLQKEEELIEEKLEGLSMRFKDKGG